MGFIAVIFFGFLVIGGSLIDSPKDNQVKTKIIEVVANKPIETKAPIKEVTPEAVKEEVKKLDSLEDSKTNYWRLVLYIIGGILFVLTGMYFFSRKRNGTQSSIQPENTEQQPVEEENQPETTEQQPVEEEIQPETTEQQPVEEEIQPETTEQQPVEEEIQPETTEQQPVEEDENNKK